MLWLILWVERRRGGGRARAWHGTRVSPKAGFACRAGVPISTLV